MGKSREPSTDDEMPIPEASVIISQKRHKKHKHKKHKKKKMMHDDAEGIVVESDRKKSQKVRGKKIEEPKKSNCPPVLGSMIDAKKISSSSSSRLAQFASFGSSSMIGCSTSVVSTTPPRVLAKKKIPKSGKGKESATSSEEERWLDAIESGKLEEVDDELKKIKPKDPKLMTARQRAMFERKTDTEPNPSVERLVSLPSGYKEKVMTAEAIQKAALKSLKRKQLADEKREKDKKKTMERLLKKQESKASKFVGKGKAWKRQVPFITYRLTAEGSWISLPPGQEFPLCTEKSKENEIQSAAQLSGVIRCSIEGCDNPKRYSCSKTGVPLCSLNCYRAHLAGILT